MKYIEILGYTPPTLAFQIIIIISIVVVVVVVVV